MEKIEKIRKIDTKNGHPYCLRFIGGLMDVLVRGEWGIERLLFCGVDI